METQPNGLVTILTLVLLAIAMLLALFTIITLQVQGGTITFSKSNFHNSLNINNIYFPLNPGTTFIYKGAQEGDPTRDTVEVTNEVKVIAGVTTRVTHDTLYVKGVRTEFTDDWYAQDDAGNVWYMGEFTTDLTNKENPHEGSWEAGVNGAKAGIIMEAQPKVGDTYQQEFAKGVAEDKATVISLNEKICVPYGCFTNVLKTKEFTPLDPNDVSNKYYARNIGDIKEISVQGESEELHLVQIKGAATSVQQSSTIQSDHLQDHKYQDHSSSTHLKNQRSQIHNGPIESDREKQRGQSQIIGGGNQTSPN